MKPEFSFLAHTTDINDLLQGLDSVLKNGLDRLHDAKTALHVVNLRLHALNSLHLASNLDKGLAVVKSLQDAGGKGLLNVLDSGSLRNGGISVASSLRALGGLEVAAEGNIQVVDVHLVVLSLELDERGEVMVLEVFGVRLRLSEAFFGTAGGRIALEGTVVFGLFGLFSHGLEVGFSGSLHVSMIREMAFVDTLEDGIDVVRLGVLLDELLRVNLRHELGVAAVRGLDGGGGGKVDLILVTLHVALERADRASQGVDAVLLLGVVVLSLLLLGLVGVDLLLEGSELLLLLGDVLHLGILLIFSQAVDIASLERVDLVLEVTDTSEALLLLDFAGIRINKVAGLSLLVVFGRGSIGVVLLLGQLLSEVSDSALGLENNGVLRHTHVLTIIIHLDEFGVVVMAGGNLLDGDTEECGDGGVFHYY